MNNENEESLSPNEVDPDRHLSSDDEIMENENYQAVSS